MYSLKFHSQYHIFNNTNFKSSNIPKQRPVFTGNIKDNFTFTGSNVTKQQNKFASHIQKLIDNYGALINYISTNSKPAEKYIKEVASQSQVLMLGNEHQHLGAKKFTISMLESLKTIGYSDIALELPLKLQPYVNSFMEGKLSENNLLKLATFRLENGLKWTPLQSGCSLKMLNECKKLNFKVHCIDSRDENFVNKLYDENFIDSLKSIGSYTASKDKQMFDNLNNRVFKKRPDAKIIIFIGSEHIVKSPTRENPNKRLRQYIDISGKKVYSINILKPEYTNDFIDMSKITKNIGFSTTKKPIADLAYSAGEDSFNQKPVEYYGKHLDGIIVVN